MDDLHTSDKTIQVNGAEVSSLFHYLDTLDRTRGQIAEHGVPVVGRPVTQPQRYSRLRAFHAGPGFAPQGTRGTLKQIAEGLVESSDAAESCRQSDFRHGHLGFMNKLLGEKNAAGLGDGNRRCSQVLQEDPPHLALPRAETLRQSLHARMIAVERAVGYESQGAGYGV